MTIVYGVLNQKGGVAKSTIAVLLAQGLAARGFATLLVDMDAQRNATKYAGFDYEEEKNIHGVLNGDIKDPSEAIQSSDIIDVLVGSNEMKNWNSEATVLKSSENRLNGALKKLKDIYEYIIIDNPPALDAASINTLVAADKLIIPSEAKAASVDGILALQEDFEEVKDLFDKPNLIIAGILPTKIERGPLGIPKKISAREQLEVMEQVAEELNTKVFKTHISVNKDYEDFTTNNINLFTQKKESVVVEEMNQFIDELLDEGEK